MPAGCGEPRQKGTWTCLPSSKTHSRGGSLRELASNQERSAVRLRPVHAALLASICSRCHLTCSNCVAARQSAAARAATSTAHLAMRHSMCVQRTICCRATALFKSYHYVLVLLIPCLQYARGSPGILLCALAAAGTHAPRPKQLRG